MSSQDGSGQVHSSRLGQVELGQGRLGLQWSGHINNISISLKKTVGCGECMKVWSEDVQFEKRQTKLTLRTYTFSGVAGEVAWGTCPKAPGLGIRKRPCLWAPKAIPAP